MDPDAALANARLALARYNAACDSENNERALAAGDRLAEAFGALDDWLSTGGFAPKAWTTLVPLTEIAKGLEKR